MGYSNVAGDLNVLATTSTQNLTVRGDATHFGNLVATQGFVSLGNVSAGNLVVTGNFTITATNTQATNALSINNSGTATALKVVQFEGGGSGHTHNVAEFWDYTTLAMVIDPEGNVGIHTTSSPGYSFTVGDGSYLTTVTSQLYTGNASGLSNLNSSNLINPLTALQLSNTQSNITSVGTLVNLNVSGTANVANGWFTTANITGGLGANTAFFNVLKTNTSNTGFLNAANGAVSNLLTSNINVVTTANMAALTVTGVLVGSLITGNASGLSNVNASNLVGNVASSNIAMSVTDPAQTNITSVGVLTALTVSGIFNSNLITGNGSGISNLNSSNLVGNVASANIASSVTNPAQTNITSVGVLTALTVSGIFNSNLITGNGSGISNLNSSNLVGNVASANIAMSVTDPAQTNITSVGVLTALTVGGVLQASLLTGNGSGISNLNSSNLVGNVASSNAALVVTQPAQPNITSVGLLTNLAVANSLSTSNLILSGNANVLGYSNLNTVNVATGNATSFGILTANMVTANVRSVYSNLVQAQNGLYAVSLFNGTYNDGVVVDYISGNGRISVGSGDSLTIYNGGVGALPIMTIGADGTLSTSNVNVASYSNLNTLNVASGNATNFGFLTANAVVANIANIYTTNIVGFIGSQWTTGVGNIFYVSNVGIGTGAVTANLQVQGNAVVSNAITTSNLILTGNATILGYANIATGNISNNFVSNLIANTLTVSGAITANATNTIFSFDTFTVPFIYATTINASSYANIVTLNTASANLSTANVSTGNLVTANILTLNVTTANLSSANVASGNLVTANILTLNATSANLSSANVASGNLVTANILTLNATTANLSSANVASGNLVTANILTLNGSSILGTNLNITGISNLSTTNVSSLNVSGAANFSSINTASANIANIYTTNIVGFVGSQWTGTVGAPIYYLSNVGIGTSTVTANLQVAGNLVVSNAITTSNLILTGNSNVSGYSNLVTANIGSANIATANVSVANVTNPIPITTGLFMNLNATYTLNATGNWYGNIASTWSSNLYTLFAPNPTASWTTYGSNPLVTGPTGNGGFRFSQTGPWAFTAVITADNNIKTLALSSNTSDVHSNLADTNVWEYVYRIGVGQDPSVPITIPFYVDNTNKYYFLDIEATNQTDNIHRTRYTNTASEAYTGSYVTLRPL